MVDYYFHLTFTPLKQGMTALFSFYKWWLSIALLTTANDASEFSGVIVGKHNSEPLANVYVYTVKGEEETLSNSSGNFRLLTWGKLPVTIYFETKGFARTKLTFTKEQKNKRVVLEAY